VRVGGAVIGAVVLAYGGSSVQRGHTDDVHVTRWLTLVLIVTGIWVLTEAIVGGFEQVARMTRERYDQLEQAAPNAYAIAAHAACETHRLLVAREAEDSPKVRMLHQ
jgi:hypothetical protein